MEYQGITLKGPFINQKVTSLPTWTASDEGREIYDSVNHKKYYGSNTAWHEQNIDKIWTHQNVAPTGWSIIAGTSDALIACKGGSQTYNTTGGNTVGTWTQPNHTLTESEMPSHWHYGVGEESSMDSWPYGRTTETNKFGMSCGMNFNNPYYKSSPTGGGAAHNHGTTYRPLANVGICIEKS